MYNGLGLVTGLLALCSFIACFVAFHLLNKIVHINENALIHINVKLDRDYNSRCQRTYIVDNVNTAHLTWLELFYMKWSVVLSIFYSFTVMILIRAKNLSNFDINFIISNTMMLVGAILSMVLLIATCILNERTPFIEVWCNEIIVYIMFFIALNVSVAVIFFLIPSLRYYLELARNYAF